MFPPMCHSSWNVRGLAPWHDYDVYLYGTPKNAKPGFSSFRLVSQTDYRLNQKPIVTFQFTRNEIIPAGNYVRITAPKHIEFENEPMISVDAKFVLSNMGKVIGTDTQYEGTGYSIIFDIIIY